MLYLDGKRHFAAVMKEIWQALDQQNSSMLSWKELSLEMANRQVLAVPQKYKTKSTPNQNPQT